MPVRDSMARAVETRPGNWVASLRGFLNEGAARVERCELCNSGIGRDHAHLVEPESGRLLCSCTPCALLFSGCEAKRYRRVPTDVTRLQGFELSDSAWNAFLIPIRLAFFVKNSQAGRVQVLYPGPAGATKSTPDLRAWEKLVEANPILAQFEDDVEALLVNRIGETRTYFRVPIDLCFELVGMIRSRWHGLSGGEGVQDAIRTFFAQLDDRAPGHRGVRDA